MKNLLSFDEFVNEHYNVQEANDADGFNPTNTTDADPVGGALASVAELTPGKEYVLTVDADKHTDMIYQGVTNGVYIFNGEDKANDVQFSEEEISALIGKGGVAQVQEGASTEDEDEE
jgi:hypothetical protein